MAVVFNPAQQLQNLKPATNLTDAPQMQQALPITGATNPDATTVVDFVGRYYINTTAFTLWYCSSLSPITWQQIAGGGGSNPLSQ